MGHKAQMNVKHVGSIASIHREVDEYMRGQVTSHRGTINKFSPQRTSNPAVALEWEARVQELHAKTQVFHKHPKRTYDPQEKAKLLEMAYYFNVYGAPF